MSASRDVSLSFSSCAWLFTYHLGAIKEVLKHRELDHQVFLGASAGSIAAMVGILKLDMEDCLDLALEFGELGRKSVFGPFGRMSNIVRKGLLSVLEPYAYLRVKDRLKVSVTDLPKFNNRIIAANDLDSNHDLLNLILASCYIPLYYERPAKFKGRHYIDGGFRNPYPALGHTIFISPTGPSKLANIQVHPDLQIPLKDVFYPNEKLMKDLFIRGEQDFAKFWQDYRIQGDDTILSVTDDRLVDPPVGRQEPSPNILNSGMKN